MEKRKPTYSLTAFKDAATGPDRLEITGTAYRSAFALGFGRGEIVATIRSMQRSHFVKSMTSYDNHASWQDVYHVPSEAGVLYIKFCAGVLAEFRLLSFKEKTQ